MKQPAIIVDIDGTLAHMSGRSPYDYTQVHTDTVDEVIRDLIGHYHRSHSIFIVSGRKNVCRLDTEDWLRKHTVPYIELYMRADGDDREDSIVKKEIFFLQIDPFYTVDFVLDDRNRVVKMWREIGLKCLQVAEGDF